MAPNERILWLDCAKGGSILLVVAYHASLYLDPHGLVSPGYLILNKLLSPIRMPLFFAISGVLAASVITRSWGDLLGKRVLLFAYLLALWSLIRWTFFGQMLSNTMTPSEGSTVVELFTMWIAPSSGLWFIWALAIYGVLAKLLRRASAPAFATIVVLSVLTFGDFIRPENFAQRNLLWYAPFFVGGAWYGRSIVREITARPVLVGAIGTAAFIGLGTLTLEGDSALLGGAAKFMLSVAGLAMGSAVAVVLARWPASQGVLSYFGRNTLPIYVAHVIFVAILAALLAAVATGTPLVRYWAVPLVMAAAVSASLLLKKLADMAGADWLYALPWGSGRYARWPFRPAMRL